MKLEIILKVLGDKGNEDERDEVYLNAEYYGPEEYGSAAGR